MIDYSFNKKLGILEVTYKGIITVDELFDYGQMLYEDDSLPRDLKVLTDVTKGEYNILPEDITAILEKLRKHVSKYENMRVAFVHTNPKSLALSYLFERRLDTGKYQHRIFSTREGALNWLFK